MKTLILCGSAAVLGLAWFGATSRAAPREAEANILNQVLVKDVGRFGVNLGGWSFWGADQFVSNILKNPGFEGLLDGAIVIPVHSAQGSFDDSPNWLAREDGFWEGSRFSIRSGTNAGSEGLIAHSSKANAWNLPAFVTREGDPLPNPGDVVALLKDTETALPTQWWFSNDPGNSFAPELQQTAPGSSGVRSLRIIAGGSNDATVASYLDSIGERAGKLLPLNGVWNLSFWTRLDKGSASLHVLFGRQGSAALLSQDVPVSSSWTHIQLTFSGADDGPTGTANLLFQIKGLPAGEVLLDDVDLRHAEDAGQPFRHEVVAMLNRLHPAYLRDWQGQLGDTLANRVAPQFARKSYRYRPGDQSDFGYGLRDFLDLCLRVHASPWIVIPTVLNDADCAGLGDYLRSQTDLAALPEILVEFGNENWNSIFRPAGIPAPAAHGEVSGRCFAGIRQHAQGLRLKTVANAQAGYPTGAIDFARQSQSTDIIALAPYFFYSLPPGLSLKDRLSVLFQPNTANVETIGHAASSLQKELAVYEVNLHTVDGDAPAAERLPAVAGIASGGALARTMLEMLALGVRRQCVYSLIGFDSQLTTQPGYIPLWGIARDVGATQRLRPTGLALELLNQAVRGDMMKVEQRANADVSVFAFKAGNQWSAVLVSSSNVARNVTLHIPRVTGTGTLPARVLTAKSIDGTNEDSETIKTIDSSFRFEGGTIVVPVEPYSVIVLSTNPILPE